ncbi:hypothetical protein V2J09_023630 [Rumex salicifolius]
MDAASDEFLELSKERVISALEDKIAAAHENLKPTRLQERSTTVSSAAIFTQTHNMKMFNASSVCCMGLQGNVSEPLSIQMAFQHSVIAPPKELSVSGLSDGCSFEKQDGVVLMATTRKLSQIGPALKRHG